jgi:BASS family bile acid:Na+ symporter
MMALFVKYTVMTSVILLMLGVGLGTPFKQVVEVARKFALVGRGVAANFVVVPLLSYLVLLWLPLSPDVKIGILLMAAAPVAPMAPPFVAMAKADVAYSVGLMAIVAVLSVVMTPLILSLTMPGGEGALVLDPMQIVKTLVTVQLIPIAAGMALRESRPTWSERLLGFVPKLGQIGLLVGVGLLLASQARQIASVEPLAWVVLIMLVVLSLGVGDWMMMGASGELRRSLAISTAIRNIPLAFVVANANFPGTVVAPVTLIFSTFTMLLSVVYGKLMLSREVGAA